MTELNETSWKEKYEKEHKLRQEAENEMVLIKGITVTNSPELRAANNEINDLKNKIANLEETVKSKDYFRDPDFKFLVDENHRLEQQYLEVMADNKKLAKQIDDKMDQLRKSGAILGVKMRLLRILRLFWKRSLPLPLRLTMVLLVLLTLPAILAWLL